MKSRSFEKRVKKLEDNQRKSRSDANIILLKGNWYPLDNRPETLKACETTPIPVHGRWWRSRNPELSLEEHGIVPFNGDPGLKSTEKPLP
jgi:hypothetical protein